MTGNQSRPSRFHGDFATKELLDTRVSLEVKVINTKIDLEIKRIDDSVTEARRQQEMKFAGFPSEYAKISDMEVTAATLKELKDKDLGGLKDLIDQKVTKGEYDQKHDNLTSAVSKVEKNIENINGRILGTGGVAIFVIVVLQVVLHVFWRN